MELEILPDAESVARAAALHVAAQARASVADRGQFVFAVSGGRTPWLMLRELAHEQIPWPKVEIIQVDERVAPAGDRDRNLTHLKDCLLSHSPLRSDQIHAMPVEQPDLVDASARYAQLLWTITGSPPMIDLVHLGLGTDGHTASLVPDDPVLEVFDHDVAPTGPYQGRRRMTLTYPTINRARRILWVVSGADKAAALAQLLAADRSIPAGRVARDQATAMADRAAAARIPSR